MAGAVTVASAPDRSKRGTTKPAIDVVAATRRYGGVVAVNEVSFSVARGERVGIIGPNGAGKTSLFKLVAGDVKPSSGQVWLDGHDVTGLSVHRRARRGLGRTFQVTNLMSSLTVEENLRLSASATRRRRLNSVYDVIEMFGLERDLDRSAGSLAYGEQRRLELALALCGGADTLLLDEPAAGLGPEDRAVMREAIEGLPAALTIMLIEHDIELALSLVTRVLCMHDGSLVADGPSGTIREHEFVRRIYLGETGGGDDAGGA